MRNATTKLCTRLLLGTQCMVQTNIVYTLIVQTYQRFVENSSSVITCAHYCAIPQQVIPLACGDQQQYFFMLQNLNVFVLFKTIFSLSHLPVPDNPVLSVCLLGSDGYIGKPVYLADTDIYMDISQSIGIYRPK